MSKNHIRLGLLAIAVLSFIAGYLVFHPEARIPAVLPQLDSVEQQEKIPTIENDIDELPLLTSVERFNKCAALNELRDVDFTNARLRTRLCENTTAYTLVGGKYPLCQLNRNLPKQIYSIVRNGAKLASVSRAMGSGFISVYTFDKADIISQYMLDYHNWETEQIQKILTLLKKLTPETVTFLDIGSNLGAYSLQARVEGFPVVAVDANIRTLIRLQLSAKELNLLDNKLKLFWCFISDEVALKQMTWGSDVSQCNVGSAAGKSNDWRQQSTTVIEDTIPVMTVRADELRQHISTKNVIMKMDIESGEHLFMKTGRKLFSEFNILAMQMEFWRKIGDPPTASPHYKFVTNFMITRNYSLLSLNNYRLQNVSTFADWDGIWVRNDFLNQVV